MKGLYCNIRIQEVAARLIGRGADETDRRACARERVNSIFVEKERYAYQLKEKAAARTHECMCVSYVHISNQYIPGRH